MKQMIIGMFSSEKVLIAFSACMYILGCVIEANI